MSENFYGDPNQVYNTYRADGSTIENNHAGDDYGGVGNRVHRYSHQAAPGDVHPRGPA